MSELKPCPFCGGEAEVIVAEPGPNEHLLFPHFGIACKQCRTMIGTVVHGMTDFYDTVDEAREAWNAREKQMCRVLARHRPMPHCVELSDFGLSCGHYVTLRKGERILYCPTCGAKIIGHCP